MNDSELNVRFSLLEQKVQTMNEDREKLDHILFGNGQPGLFDRIEGQFKSIHAQMTKIIFAVGFLCASIGGAAGALGHALFGGG